MKSLEQLKRENSRMISNRTNDNSFQGLIGSFYYGLLIIFQGYMALFDMITLPIRYLILYHQNRLNHRINDKIISRQVKNHDYRVNR